MSASPPITPVVPFHLIPVRGREVLDEVIPE